MAPKKKGGFITINRDLCKGCYMCISVCPNHLISISKQLNQKGYYPAAFMETEPNSNARTCTGCATCAIICPDVAIEVYRESKATNER